MEVMAHDFFTEQPTKGTFFPSTATSLSETQIDLTCWQGPSLLSPERAARLGRR